MKAKEILKLQPAIDFYLSKWNIPIWDEKYNEKNKNVMPVGDKMISSKYTHCPIEMIRFAQGYAKSLGLKCD